MVKKTTISSNLEEARSFEESLLRKVARCGYDHAGTFAIKLAVEEALNNAIKHGNRNDPGKSIEIAYEVDRRKVVVTIMDNGKGFDPGKVPDPTADENLEKPCGRGIMLMRAYMDEVEYNDCGNKVRLVKRCASGA